MLVPWAYFIRNVNRVRAIRKLPQNYIFVDAFFTPRYGLIRVAVDWPTAAWYESSETVFLNFSTGEARQLLDREVLEPNARE